MKNVIGLLCCALILGMGAQAAPAAKDPRPPLLIKKNTKFGFVNMAGNVVIPLKYFYATPFSDGLALVGDDMPKDMEQFDPAGWERTKAYYLITGTKLAALAGLSYIDTKGKVVIPPGQFDMVEPFKEGMARVYVDKRVGFIDTTGKTVIPPTFEDARDFSDGMAAVNTGGGWGYVDKTGTLVVKPRFEEASGFTGGAALVKEAGKWAVIDSQGKVAFQLPGEPISTSVYSMVPRTFSEGFMPVKVPSKTSQSSYRFVGKDGAALPGTFTAVKPFSGGLAPVQESGAKWGFIDVKGKVVIPAAYDDAFPFSDGLAPVKSGEKWGFIDTTGAVAIPATFDDAGRFSEGLAAVKTGAKWGYIDKTGKLVIKDKRYGDFENGTAGGPYGGYIDKKGEVIWSPD